MKKIFKQLLMIIFWSSLYFLSVFYIPDSYYPQWAVSFFLFFIFISFISFKIIPSKKDEKLYKKILEDYKEIVKLEDDVRKNALQLELTCPDCKTSNNYWSYLDDHRCNKCGSEVWSTVIKDLGKNYEKIFNDREKIFAFYSKINGKTKRKLKKNYFSGMDK